MIDSGNELTLDEMFERLEKLPVPEGYKSEIVGGHVFLWPQRNTSWDITINILGQLRAAYPHKRLRSDVRMDCPGRLNGFAPDVVALADGPDTGRDAEFVAEVITRETASNDYGPKKDAYAAAGVPVYLIVDPYTGEWHLHTIPKDGKYHSAVSFGFGEDIDLTGTAVGLTLTTDDFPRD
ncbi:Uma2 family endonuclease [Streptomyces sp. AC512_CC834]|uniref:Uma2 family endonuclease n=1 Tax=Streptomyces sp. AC512_CC834 TaxID=2823691 RepID=UPI001C271BB5|nr:Uma2 family endonuclease [Streptomyces sp. AC512_CC834]